MVGRGGVEPPTSRLSGVRSNHLSYRPPHSQPIRQKPFGLARPARAHPSNEGCSRMKGHEDGRKVIRIWCKIFRYEKDRKSCVWVNSVSVSVGHVGARIIE